MFDCKDNCALCNQWYHFFSFFWVVICLPNLYVQKKKLLNLSKQILAFNYHLNISFSIMVYKIKRFNKTNENLFRYELDIKIWRYRLWTKLLYRPWYEVKYGNLLINFVPILMTSTKIYFTKMYWFHAIKNFMNFLHSTLEKSL